jgi:extracellular elastinolytic metalloproteinase
VEYISFLARGNNVIVLINGSTTTLENQHVPKAINDPNGIFDNPYDPDSPLNLGNLNATIDNVFYVMNSMHDFAYGYGFTEDAGNFQVDNFGRGGGVVGTKGSAGGDPVGVSIHDFTGVDNAFFSTPPE